MKSTRSLFAAWLFLFPILLGCQGSNEPEAKESVPVGISGVNHTDIYIAEFYVEGSYGGNVDDIKNGGSGGITCCVVLPYHYRPGLTAKVRWNHTETRDDHWKETTATVLPYPDGGGQAWVNFLPDDRVVILVSNFAPWHEKYRVAHKAPSHPNYQGADVEFPKDESKP